VTSRWMWTEVSDLGPPSTSRSNAMGYHTASGHPILMTGPDISDIDSDTPEVLTARTAQTWEWDNGWSFVQDMGPTARFGAAVSESHDGSVILFGGHINQALRDTWTWDGSAWTLAEDSGPSARTGAALLADPTRGRDILFGGMSYSADSNSSTEVETWQWDGTYWSPIDNAGPRLNGPKLGWDAPTSTLVLLGNIGSRATTETYIWAQEMWVQVNDLGPDAPIMTLLSAPMGSIAVTPRGTWAWNGARRRWTQVQDTGPRSTDLCGVWDPGTNVGIVFDALTGSTWRLKPPD
jgi:hypothetical protein